MMAVDGEIELAMAGEFLQRTLDIRLLHEAEMQLDADDAAALADRGRTP